MKTNRFNSFNMIHKALRSMLFEYAVKFQHTDYTKKEETLALLDELGKVIEMIDHHAESEDKFLFPLIEKHDQKLYSEFLSEHDEDHRLSMDLKNKIDMYIKTGPDDLQEKGVSVFYSFMNYIAFNLKHLNKEEIEFNEVVWQHYTDDEIKAINRKVVSELSQEQKDQTGYWIMKGCNNKELKDWFSELKQVIPPHPFSLLLEKAKNIVGIQRWETITEGIRTV